MANKKIIDLDNGTPKINSFFESTQVDANEPTGRKSTKINFTDMGNWVAGQGLSPLEYGNLSTESKRLVGAINELNSLISAQYPINEASGAIANFNTQIAAPLVDVTLQINAQQASGTPTPINPLPITGFTGANIPHTKENLVGFSNVDFTIQNLNMYSQGTNLIFDGSNSSDISSADSNWKNNLKFTLPAGTYYFKSALLTGSVTTIRKVSDDTVITQGGNSFTFTLTEQTEIYIGLYIPANSSFSALEYNLMISKDDISYISFSGSTISVDWTDEAGTVYGGELDLLSGVLTVNYASVDLGSLSWYYAGSGTPNTRFQGAGIESLVKKAATQTEIADLICSIFKNASAASIYGGSNYSVGVNTDGTIWIRDDDYTDAPNFKTAMTGITLYYPLATPVEYQLTAQQMSALVGVNNIWHDANGDTDVKFKQDIQGYIDEKIASVQALVLNS